MGTKDMGNIIPFNPLDKKHLGESVGQAMLRQTVFSLNDLAIFKGAGIYAIYYTGNFPAYKPIADANKNSCFNAPIYVGKAIPSGARKGNNLEFQIGSDLWKRLKEHARSIEQVSNLETEDFFYRFLIVDDIWIPLGETLLIAKFNPLWNVCVDGFGNHNPGRGRHKGMRPRWDVLHHGRPWADLCEPRLETKEQIMEEIRNYMIYSENT